MFLLAGRVLQRYRTTEIAGVSGLLRVMPGTGWLFLAGRLALVGLPPFGLFVSEFALLPGGLRGGPTWLMGVVLVLLPWPSSAARRAPEPDAVRRRRLG